MKRFNWFLFCTLFFLAIFSMITFPSCRDDAGDDNVIEPATDTIHLVIEGVNVSNGIILETGFTTVKIKGVFTAFVAESFTIASYGYVVAKIDGPNPTIGNNVGMSVEPERNGIGEFTSIVEGLEPGMDYKARVYVEKVDNDSGNSVFIYHDYFLTFSTFDPEVPDVETEPALDITESSFRLRGAITDFKDLPVTEHGFVWSTTISEPTKENNHGEILKGAVPVSASHNFDAPLDGLDLNTTYYCRAFAVNEYGTGYGVVIEVTTSDPQPPEVVTVSLGEETINSFVATGTITDFMGYSALEHGFIWSENPNPDVNNGTKINLGAQSVVSEYNFSTVVSGLIQNTTYYCKAYAINEFGTNYGLTLTIVTATPEAPTVSTVSIGSETDISFFAQGLITDFNGFDVTEHGFVFSSNTTMPTLGNSVQVTLGSQSISAEHPFDYIISGLIPNTTYYCRAYASNDFEIGYGDVMSVTTLSAPSANLVITNTVLNGDTNNNGAANPGETITLLITVQNVGNLGADGVTANISSFSSYVESIPNLPLSFGNLAPSSSNTSQLTVNIAASTPWDTNISFNAELSDNQGNNWFPEPFSIDVVSPVVVLDNLIAYYTFDDQDGTDLVGGFDCTEIGSISYSTDIPGTEGGHAISFSADPDSYLYRGGTHPFSSPFSSITWSVWIKTPSNGGILGVGNLDQCCSGLKFRIDDGKVYYSGSSTSFSNFDATNLLLTNQWEHLAVTVEAGAQKLYVNGVEVTATAWSGGFYIPNTNYPMYIGRIADSASSAFNGKIDNLRIYNVALSASDVMEIYGARQ